MAVRGHAGPSGLGRGAAWRGLPGLEVEVYLDGEVGLAA